MDQKRKELFTLLKGSGINIIFEIANRGLTFLLIVLLTRFFKTEDAGYFFWGFATISMFAIIPMFGLDRGILKLGAKYLADKEYGKVRFIMSRSLVFVVLLSLFIMAGILAVPAARESILLIFIPYIFLSSIQKVFRSVIWATGDMFSLNLSIISETIFRFAILSHIFTPLPINTVVYIYLGAVLINIVIEYLILRSKQPRIFSSPSTRVPLKELINISLPLFFASLTFVLMTNIDTFMIGVFRPMAEVAFYRVAVRSAFFLLLPMTLFSRSLIPHISKEGSFGKQFRHTYHIFNRMILLVSFPLLLIFLLFSEQVAGIFGSDYITLSGIILTILSSGLILNIITGLNAPILSFGNMQKAYFLILLVVLLVNLILNYLLIPRFGALGAAYATAMSYILLSIIISTTVFIKYRFHPFNLSYLTVILIFGLFFTGSKFFLSHFSKNLLTLTITFLSIYLMEFLFIVIFRRKSYEYQVIMKTCRRFRINRSSNDQ